MNFGKSVLFQDWLSIADSWKYCFPADKRFRVPARLPWVLEPVVPLPCCLLLLGGDPSKCQGRGGRGRRGAEREGRLPE
jgi:hypothetical protein